MNALNPGTRILTMSLDHFVMTFAAAFIAMPGMAYDMAQSFANPDAPLKLFLGNLYVNVFAFSLYFNKDIYLGRSVGKRIFGLQIVDAKTNRPAGPLRCFIRNVTVILWPIELIVALVNNERRIGDLIAGTKLMTFNQEQHQTRINWLTIFLSIVISCLFTYFAMFYPFVLMFKDSGFAM